MTETVNRTLPKPDPFATCPLDGKILDYYAGTFEAVFVLLHPFIHPVSGPLDIFTPSDWPSTSSIVANCEAVTWSEVASIANLKSLNEVDIGLRTRIGGLNAAFANQSFSAAIAGVCERHSIVPPDEGSFSDLLHDKVLQCFQNAGHDWVWVGDEFCTERTLHWIEDLKGNKAGTTDGHCNVFSPDKSLLWTTHWDSHFSFVCGAKAELIRFVREMNFEGFFCDSKTEVYWSVRID